MRKSKTARIAAIATGLMLAIAAPAVAQTHGGHSGGGGGHVSGGGGHFSGGGRGSSGGGRGFAGGGFRGGRDFRGGGAFLGGLALGYALDPYPYYGGPYYGGGYGYEDDYGPGQCLTEQRVWDPRYGRYMVREVPYPC
ncbi:MAG TPA: hypothetical protein VHN39_14685 [Phenylobacterium sp.]|nr:hypothetical protein [Phenylobacterium sp.]